MPLIFVDQEDPAATGGNDGWPMGGAGWENVLPANGIIFPWCINSLEVKRKSFCVYYWNSAQDPTMPYARGPALAYIFQDYLDNQIYWLRPSNPVWADRMYCQEGPCSYANLYLTGTSNDPNDLTALESVTIVAV
jgi:hypothetical protein